MATLLARIETSEEPPPRHIKRTTLDVGRTLAITILGGLCIVGAVALFLGSHNTAATTVLGAAEAIIFGGLGIAYGERSGAREAARQLLDEADDS